MENSRKGQDRNMFPENEKENPYFEAMICNTIEFFKGKMDFGIELLALKRVIVFCLAYFS